MKIIGLICLAIIAFLVVRSIVKSTISAIRTYQKAKQAGILKTCITARALVFSLIGIGLVVFGIISSFVTAANLRHDIKTWENILNNPTVTENFKKYYNEHYTESMGEKITDIEKYAADTIRSKSESEKNLRYSAAFYSILIVLFIFWDLDRVFYITEVGCITKILNEPGELVVKRGGRKLDVYFKAAPEKILISLNPTPKNLAAVGRFIEDSEQL